MIVRPRIDKDIERCVSLLRTIYATDAYPVNWPRDPARWVAGQRTIAAWVSEVDDELVGHVALTAPDPERDWRDWQAALNAPPGQLAVVRRLFVAPQWRRRGIGTRLLKCVQREAADRGLALALDVADHNREAIAFWRRHGWREVGEASLPPGDEGRELRLLLFVGPAE